MLSNSSLLHTGNTWICEWPKDTKLMIHDHDQLISYQSVAEHHNQIWRILLHKQMLTTEFEHRISNVLLSQKNDSHHSKFQIPKGILKQNLNNNRSSKIKIQIYNFKSSQTWKFKTLRILGKKRNQTSTFQ